VEKELEERLRRRIEELVRERLGSLEQDISHLQSEIGESFTRLLERTDLAGTLSEADESIDRILADVSAGIGDARAEGARLGADIALLRDSVVELDGQKTQAEVLNALVGRTANFAPRTVLFVVKGGNAMAWAARGIEAGGDTSIRGFSVPLKSDTVVHTAFESQEPFYGGPDERSDDNVIFNRLGGPAPQRVLAIPLRVRGKCAAILYADSADRGEEAINVEAIELLMHTAGLVVELVSLRSRIGEGAPVAAPQQRHSSSLPQSPASNSGELSSGELPHQAPAPPPPASPGYFRAASEPAHAAEHKVSAQYMEAPRETPRVEPPRATDWGAARPGVSEEEERSHNEARRFARLLVSEIKLYNEQKVLEGRRNGDLYDRLKEDIDRSRQMYEKRVTPNVAARFDYFYDELVNTLAEGDAGKLGSDFPGPTVAM
jgi:hypothetical protein